MSCYVCSTRLIMDLTRAIKDGQFEKYMEEADKELFKNKKPNVLFKELYALNVQAVNERYHEEFDKQPSETYKEIDSGSFAQTAENLVCFCYQCSGLEDINNPLFKSLMDISERIPKSEYSENTTWDW